ncbi:MAG TPA: SHOCT domain-containing protein [Lachnospiraceae bacterium]|nr:SHOCT domain-containing protein [Lachnospiraceae bacterium]
MTKEQSSREVEYKMSLKLLNILLNRGIITEEEYIKIDELNRQTFSPELSELIGTVISGFLAVFRRNSDFSPNYNHFSSPNN